VSAFWLAVRICQGYSSGPVDTSQMPGRMRLACRIGRGAGRGRSFVGTYVSGASIRTMPCATVTAYVRRGTIQGGDITSPVRTLKRPP
jgi:hypothetical protein